MQTKLVSSKIDQVASKLLVIFVIDTSDKKKKPAEPALKALAGGAASNATKTVLESGEFAAGSGETLLLHAPDGVKAERILLVGMGKLTTTEVRKAAGVAVRFAKPRKLRELSIVLPEGLDPVAATRALVEGAYIGDFDPDTYRSDRKDQSIETLNVISDGGNQGAMEGGLREGVILGEA